MATDGSALGGRPAPRGRRGTSRRRPFSVAVRLLLLGACSFLVWCGLAFLTSPAASAAEVDTDIGSSAGLLDGGLLGEATDSVATVADSVTAREHAESDSSAPSRHTATEQRADLDRGDGVVGTLTTSTVRTSDRSLAPVRAVVDPAGATVLTDLHDRSAPVRPMLASAHSAGQAVLGGVTSRLSPLTGTVPLSAGMPLSLDTVTSHLDAVTGAGRTLAAPASTSAAFQAADDAADTGTNVAGDDGRSRSAVEAPRHAGGVPAQQQDDDGAPEPAGGPSAPVGTTTSSTQLGNGSGSAGGHAYAELVRMLAAWRPSAVEPTTDADISSGDEGRPSVSPD